MDERVVYAVVGLFLLFGLWMYAVNTIKIRQMALTKERLHARVQTLCHVGSRQMESVESLEQVSETSHPALFRFLDAIEQLWYQDEYVFVLDTEGRAWADGSHPQGPQRQPGLRLESGQEETPLSKLLHVGGQGGGFVNYEWKHPTNGDMKPKLSYVMQIGNTPFLLGCGTYT